MMQVRHVRLGGIAVLLPQEIEQTRSAATIDPHSNLFRLRLAALEKRLSALPWVARADAHRQFPNGVAVAITPRRSAAHLEADGQDWEIDSTGVIIRPLRPGATLPLVTCNGLAEAEPGARVDILGIAGALKVLSDCTPKGGVRIAKVVVDQTGELCLNMTDNVAIRLGQEEQLSTKIDYVHRIYDEKPGIGSEVESIDLRWPESPSCVLRGSKKPKADEPQRSTPLDAGNKPDSVDRD
jgi:cell division protein FtsQ